LEPPLWQTRSANSSRRRAASIIACRIPNNGLLVSAQFGAQLRNGHAAELPHVCTNKRMRMQIGQIGAVAPRLGHSFEFPSLSKNGHGPSPQDSTASRGVLRVRGCARLRSALSYAPDSRGEGEVAISRACPGSNILRLTINSALGPLNGQPHVALLGCLHNGRGDTRYGERTS
jgi:hypothetical protein